MREILFRGKRICDGEWVYGDLLHLPHGTAILTNGYANVIPETAGQYTGIKDKNGKKIFEGDITRHRSSYSGNMVIAVVKYEDGCFLAMPDKYSGFNLSDNIEVFGNIHDDIELLEG